MTAQDLILALHGAQVVDQTADWIIVKFPLRPDAFLSVDDPPFGTTEPDATFELAPVQTPEQQFDTFWSLYPRKVGKGAARTAFHRKGKTHEIREAIIHGLRKQVPAMREKELEYIPHPATWLNQERWTDVIEDGGPAQQITYPKF
jgi:hypothetical protein